MIYEYKCHDCGDVSEFWMKLSDPAPSECPACKGTKLERLISKTSFALKGSGWYTSDYKRAGGGSSSASTNDTSTTTTDKTATAPASESKAACCGGGSCSHGKKD